MKQSLAIFLLFISLSSYSQEFEGRLAYQRNITYYAKDSLNPKKVVTDSSYLYLSKGNHKWIVFDPGGFVRTEHYVGKKKRLYKYRSDSKYATWYSCDKPNKKLLSYTIEKHADTVLGVLCDAYIFITNEDTIIHYHSSQYFLNPEYYKNYKRGLVSELLAISGGQIRLKTIHKSKEGIEVSTPVRADRQKIAKDFFRLPESLVYYMSEPDKHPAPEKGIEAFSEYLSRNLKYPQQAQQAGIEGRVFVSFIVDKKGRITNPEVVKGIGGNCDQEALRVVKECTIKWKPALSAGKKVPGRLIVPIAFRLV